MLISLRRGAVAAALVVSSVLVTAPSPVQAAPLGPDLTWPTTDFSGYSENLPWAIDMALDDSGRPVSLILDTDENDNVVRVQVSRALAGGGVDTGYGLSGSALFSPAVPLPFGGAIAGFDSAGRVFVNIPAGASSAQTVVLNATGQVDNTFGTGGRAPGFTVAVNDDGTSWVAQGAAITRRNANGVTIAGTLPNGFVTEISGSPDRLQVCANDSGGGFCARYTPEGAIDNSFGFLGVVGMPQIPGSASRYLVDGPSTRAADGSTFVSVADGTGTAASEFGIVKFFDVGLLSSGWGAGGIVLTDSVFDIAVTTDGSVYSIEESAAGDLSIFRYTATGAFDPVFGEVPTTAFELEALGNQAVTSGGIEGPIVVDASGLVQTLAGDWFVAYATLATPSGLLVTGDPEADFSVGVTRYLPLAPAYTALPAPQRLLDTRAGQLGVLEQPSGTIGSDVTVPLTADVPLRLSVANQAGLPANPAGIALNATVAAPPAGGFLKIYPCASVGTTPPATSTVNYRANLTAGNSAVVAQNSGGICLVASQSVNVILDATGFFATGFNALPNPQRLYDSRGGQLGVLEQPGGTIGSDVAVPLTANVPIRLNIANQGGLPANPTGLALNVTVFAPPGGGFVKIYPCSGAASTAAPATSSLNYVAGATTGNSAIVAQSQGGICVVSSQTANVIIDATGFFTAGFAPLPQPQRLLDTRPAPLIGVLELPGGSIGSDVATPLVANVPARFIVANEAGLPTSAGGIMVNSTVVGPSGGGFVKIYPCTSTATPPPATSSLNYNAGITTGNSAIVAPASGGICVVASRTVNFVLDTTGFTI